MSTTYRYYKCDVFADRPFAGNPLAIFPDARDLNANLMRDIARELNVSKTAFVFNPGNPFATHRLRNFSPTGELPVCYDTAIGTALVLAWIGDIPPANGGQLRCRFECGAAPLEVLMATRQNDYAVVQVAAGCYPEPGPPAPPLDLIAAALSLDPADLVTTAYPPRVLICGFSCLFVQLRSLDAIQRVQLDGHVWDEVAARCKANGVYSFTHETVDSGSDLHCRFMAPALGVDEEPATGSAAVGLAMLLADGEIRDTCSVMWRIEQGIEIGRPSRLLVGVEKRLGALSGISVSGTAVYLGQGEIELEPGDADRNAVFGPHRNTMFDDVLAAP